MSTSRCRGTGSEAAQAEEQPGDRDTVIPHIPPYLRPPVCRARRILGLRVQASRHSPRNRHIKVGRHKKSPPNHAVTSLVTERMRHGRRDVARDGRRRTSDGERHSACLTLRGSDASPLPHDSRCDGAGSGETLTPQALRPALGSRDQQAGYTRGSWVAAARKIGQVAAIAEAARVQRDCHPSS